MTSNVSPTSQRRVVVSVRAMSPVPRATATVTSRGATMAPGAARTESSDRAGSRRTTPRPARPSGKVTARADPASADVRAAASRAQVSSRPRSEAERTSAVPSSSQISK